VFRRFGILLILVNLVACAIQKQAVVSSSDVRRIRNSDIRWGGNPLGLYPTFSGASKRIVDNRSANLDELVVALVDERRFVAAHVLLYYVEWSFDRKAGRGD